MAGKTRDFSALQAGLAKTHQPALINQPPARGRPTVDTMPLQLRLPRSILGALVKEAAETSIAEGRNVTPQQVINRMLEARYNG